MRLLYLVQVRTRFGGYTFKCLHILNEELTSSLDCSGVGTILPARAESRVDQAVSPGGIKTCRLGVYTGYLSASNEAMGKFSGSISHLLGIAGKNSQVPEF